MCVLLGGAVGGEISLGFGSEMGLAEVGDARNSRVLRRIMEDFMVEEWYLKNYNIYIYIYVII